MCERPHPTQPRPDTLAGLGERTELFSAQLRNIRRAPHQRCLQSNWATRQTILQQLEDNGTPWSTYGAELTAYAAARTELTALTALGTLPRESTIVIDKH